MSDLRTRERFVEEARALVGTRFRHQGRSETEGVDCLGLVVVAADRAGWPEARERDRTDYRRRPDAEHLRALLSGNLQRLNVDQRQHGDILLMVEGGITAHMGVVDLAPEEGTRARERMIHAYAPLRGVIREYLNLAHRRAVAAYRLPE